MIIIAVSGKRRSGKTTLGDILKKDYGFTPVSLAERLKHMVEDHFGLIPDQTDGHLKEQPTQYKQGDRFLTPRDIMISFGQYYRSVDPMYWVKKLHNRMLSEDAKYVVTDVRFKNELEYLQQRGALTVRLERDESLTGTYINDPSETELDSYPSWDIKIPSEQNVYRSDLLKTAQVINDRITAKA